MKSWNSFLTESQDKEVIRLYQEGFNSRQLAQQFGFKTKKSILDILNKHHINKREPKKSVNYNVDFFKQINTKEKAYTLGLMITDGYLYRINCGIAIQLCERDKEILYTIKSFLGESTTIIKINSSPKLKKINYKHKAQDQYRLVAYSPQIAESLIKGFGFSKNKTYNIEYPQIDNSLKYHFLRGLWDGDGTICKDKRGYLRCRILSASKSFIDGLHSDLSKQRFGPRFNNTREYSALVLGKQEEIIRFINAIYAESEHLRVEGKYEKISNFLH